MQAGSAHEGLLTLQQLKFATEDCDAIWDAEPSLLSPQTLVALTALASARCWL